MNPSCAASAPLPPGLVISAPASGMGKTTVMLGLLRAFAEDGLAVQPFKSGPDYIDPAFHRAAAGRASFNLDTWAMDKRLLRALIETAADADLCLCEGSMGLFDGVAQCGATARGATADLAALLGWPVVLVIDARGQAQSVGAVALGFGQFQPTVTIAGVILNRLASARHERLARLGVEAAGLRVFGALPRQGDLTLPERHLGLVQAVEHPDLQGAMARYAAFLSAHVDIAALVEAARGTDPLRLTEATVCSAAFPPPPAQRIALAQDAAFSFTYPHVVEGWRRQGAEILPFSPLADEPPHPEADLVWLPGGYPELHAGRLAAAERFLDGLRRHAKTRPVHGECGGYMVLGEALIDKAGERHQMAGLLGLVTSFADRRLALGYRRAELLTPILGFSSGQVLFGHEFHYATIVSQPDQPLARVSDADGLAVAETGSRRGAVSGTFFHLIAAGQARGGRHERFC